MKTEIKFSRSIFTSATFDIEIYYICGSIRIKNASSAHISLNAIQFVANQCVASS